MQKIQIPALPAAKNFLFETHSKKGRQKRGGDSQHLAFDTLSISEESVPSPDVEFNHVWACAVLDRAVSNPKREMQEKGEARTLVAPRPFLAGASDYGDLVTVADKLGISETAVGAIFHRMRKRMCELVKTEVERRSSPEATSQKNYEICRGHRSRGL